MNNLSQNIETLSIKELESLQEELREKLRHIQEQIDLEQQSNSKINEAIIAVKCCKEWIDQFRPAAKDKFQNAVFNCFDGHLTTPVETCFVANGNESQQRCAVDGHQANAITNVGDKQPLTIDKATESKNVENHDSEENDEAFEEYIHTPAEPEISLDQLEAKRDDSRPPTVAPSQTYTEFVNLSPKVGYLRRTGDGAILGAYLGGKNKSLLEVWAKCVAETSLVHGIKCEYEVRSATRLKNFKYEAKFKKISFSVLEAITQIDTGKSPKFNGADIIPILGVDKPTISLVPKENPTDVSTDAEEETPSLRVGDRVLIKTDRHGQEYENKIGIVSAPTKLGAAINVSGTLKYFHAEEVEMVEQSSENRNPANDLAVSISAPLDLTDDVVPW